MNTLTISQELYERLRLAMSGSSRFISEEEFIQHALDLVEAKEQVTNTALVELGEVLNARRNQPAVHEAPSVASLRQRYLSDQYLH